MLTQPRRQNVLEIHSEYFTGVAKGQLYEFKAHYQRSFLFAMAEIAPATTTIAIGASAAEEQVTNENVPGPAATANTPKNLFQSELGHNVNLELDSSQETYKVIFKNHIKEQLQQHLHLFKDGRNPNGFSP
jgi:hypothetical protein